jgi:hypothetical protein
MSGKQIWVFALASETAFRQVGGVCTSGIAMALLGRGYAC